ncbi:hypothetical protein Q3O59_00555 [Alkalimonas delamerensis]|uniref:Uncharacterized protein n=1 Tax=Alkalimonas delamerensis TaxID=265981 RepID=A0ABT9GKM4_9GAMM|nr:hypothetical protein [Alkalimonas delamerensis]MDP4527517.1 hypothetical protein [Alkalimonas delamerensis]
MLIALCSLLQLFYLLALWHLGWGFYYAFEALSTEDPRLVAGALSEGIVLSWLAVIPATAGLALSVYLTGRNKALARWFSHFTRIASFCWLAFIPIGTVLGHLQLKRLRQQR